MPQLPTGQFDRGTIIDLALRRVGNTAIKSDARQWLDQILFDLYTQFTWPFLLTSTTFSLTTRTFTLPSNFLRTPHDQAHQITAINGSTTRGTIFEVPRPDLETRPSDTTGVPRIWTANLALGEGIVWPTPASAQTVATQLLYYQLPAQLTSDTDVPTFPWSQYLVQMVYVRALEYERDQRSVQETQRAQLMLNALRNTAFPLRQLEPTVPLDAQVFSPGYRDDIETFSRG